MKSHHPKKKYPKTIVKDVKKRKIIITYNHQ